MQTLNWKRLLGGLVGFLILTAAGSQFVGSAGTLPNQTLLVSMEMDCARVCAPSFKSTTNGGCCGTNGALRTTTDLAGIAHFHQLVSGLQGAAADDWITATGGYARADSYININPEPQNSQLGPSGGAAYLTAGYDGCSGDKSYPCAPGTAGNAYCASLGLGACSRFASCDKAMWLQVGGKPACRDGRHFCLGTFNGNTPNCTCMEAFYASSNPPPTCAGGGINCEALVDPANTCWQDTVATLDIRLGRFKHCTGFTGGNTRAPSCDSCPIGTSSPACAACTNGTCEYDAVTAGYFDEFNGMGNWSPKAIMPVNVSDPDPTRAGHDGDGFLQEEEYLADWKAGISRLATLLKNAGRPISVNLSFKRLVLSTGWQEVIAAMKTNGLDPIVFMEFPLFSSNPGRLLGQAAGPNVESMENTLDALCWLAGLGTGTRQIAGPNLRVIFGAAFVSTGTPRRDELTAGLAAICKPTSGNGRFSMIGHGYGTWEDYGANTPAVQTFFTSTASGNLNSLGAPTGTLQAVAASNGTFPLSGLARGGVLRRDTANGAIYCSIETGSGVSGSIIDAGTVTCGGGAITANNSGGGTQRTGIALPAVGDNVNCAMKADGTRCSVVAGGTLTIRGGMCVFVKTNSTTCP